MQDSSFVRRLCGKGVFFGLALLGGVAVGGYEPVLHERFEPDPKEDMAFGVRVTASALPAALQTTGGVVKLPDPIKEPADSEPIYSEVRRQAPSRLRMDNHTTDPGQLNYHEPFRPSIAPFKRTHVFDGVDSEFALTVTDSRSHPVALEQRPSATVDQFFADFVVEARGDEMIRIPSAGPYMKVYAAHLEPLSPFGFYVDRAENWFVRAPSASGRVRLVMHVGVERAAFDGRIEATSYSSLGGQMPTVPANVEHAAAEMLLRIGVSRVFAPADALAALVAYFRGFTDTRDFPEKTSPEQLYRALVTSKKGVCRHRAYAFMITSLGLGIPARFVHNEAHAWVEVYGGKLWHRIDLGGAASGFNYEGEPPSGNPHRPPADPFVWPKTARTTESALPKVRPVTSGGQPTEGGPTEARAPIDDKPESAKSEEQASEPGRYPGRIRIMLGSGSQIMRGDSVAVKGAIISQKTGCGAVVVDLSLSHAKKRILGSVTMTNDRGEFDAMLVVPSDLPVGKYQLSAKTRGNKTCPAASTE